MGVGSGIILSALALGIAAAKSTAGGSGEGQAHRIFRT